MLTKYLRKRLIGSLICLGIALLIVYMQFRWLSDKEVLNTRGASTAGMIDVEYSKTERGASTYKVRVKYEVNGQTYYHTQSVPKEFVNRNSSSVLGYYVQSIPVKYVPEDPSTSVLVHRDIPETEMSLWPWVIAAIFGALGLLDLYGVIRSGSKETAQAKSAGANSPDSSG